MAANQFKAFGTGGSPNTLTPTAYAARSELGTGFLYGTADSQMMNTVWRQSAMVAATIGQVVANAGIDALDDNNYGVMATHLITALNALLTNRSATGVVEAFAGVAPPAGTVECNGQSLDRTTYAALFTVVGVTYGAVDGTHFNVPDLRGQFVRGWSHGAGLDAGRSFGSTQGYGTAAPQTTTVSHISDSGITTLTSASNPSKVGFARAARSGESVTTVGVDSAQPVLGELDLINVATGDAETRPVNVALMYIIWL